MVLKTNARLLSATDFESELGYGHGALGFKLTTVGGKTGVLVKDDAPPKVRIYDAVALGVRTLHLSDKGQARSDQGPAVATALRNDPAYNSAAMYSHTEVKAKAVALSEEARRRAQEVTSATTSAAGDPDRVGEAAFVDIDEGIDLGEAPPPPPPQRPRPPPRRARQTAPARTAKQQGSWS